MKKISNNKNQHCDDLYKALDACVFLSGWGNNLSSIDLERYSKYSIFLEFIMHPTTFDYSRVNINNGMWYFIIRSQKYSHYFIEHKKELLTKNLERIFLNNQDSRMQQKVLYGLLLKNEELWKYGEEKFW